MSRAVRKAVVLAGGRGTRMQRADAAARLDADQAAAAAIGAKGMMPIRGRPFLDYVLSGLADAGIDEVCFVTPPGGATLRAHYAAAPSRRGCASPSRSSRSRGGAATPCSRPRRLPVGTPSSRPTPTTCIRLRRLGALRDLSGSGLPVFERERLLATSNFTRERVDAFAVLEVAAQGWLERIIEKPPAVAGTGTPVLLSMNLWRFSPAIFEACRSVPLSRRGECELPQAVGWAIANRGERFQAVACADGVLDLSTRADVAEVEGRLAGREPRP